MQKTGQLLKETREKKGLTIAEIAHVTKINPKTLEALERGDTSGLPQKAFIRGFVQTYAKYLGLDVNETLKLFQEEMGQTKPELPSPQMSSTPGSNEEATQTKVSRAAATDFENDPRGKSRAWAIGIASVLLVLLIGFVVQMIQKYEKESELPKDSIEVAKIDLTSDTLGASTTTLLEDEAQTESTTTSTTLKDTLVAVTTPSSSSTTSTTHLVTTTTTTSRSTTTLKPTTTTTSRTTTTTRATTTTSRSTTTSTTLKTTTTTTTLMADKPGKIVEVIVEALDNVTLGFRIDSGAFMTIKLAPQQVHTFKAKSSLNIDVSDGGAINIIYNGQDRGVPGSLGQSIKLKYP